MHRDQLVKEIATLKTELKDPALPADIRQTLASALKTAEGMLEKMDKDKAKVANDPRLEEKPKPKAPPGAMTKADVMKKVSPSTRAELKKKLDGDDKELSDCMKILAAYKAKKSKVESKRIEKRKAAGKPAELTIPETVKKAAQSVAVKVDKKEEQGKTISKPESNAVITQIVKLVGDLLEIQKDDKNGRDVLNTLISKIESAAKTAGIEPQSTGLKFAKGGQLGTDWNDADEYFHVRMTIKKALGQAKDMSGERRVLNRALESVRKIAEAHDITLDKPMRNYRGDSTVPDINGYAPLGPDWLEVDKAIKDGFANFKTKAKQKEYLDNVTKIVHFIGNKEERLGYAQRSFKTQFEAGGEIKPIRNSDLKKAVDYLESTGAYKMHTHKGAVDMMGNGERVVLHLVGTDLYVAIGYDPTYDDKDARLLMIQNGEFYRVEGNETKYRLANGRAIERAVNEMRTGNEKPGALYKEDGGMVDMIGQYRGQNIRVLTYQTENFDADENAGRIFSILASHVRGKNEGILISVAEDVDRALGVSKQSKIGPYEVSTAISLTMRSLYLMYPLITAMEESQASSLYPTFLHTNIVKILVKRDQESRMLNEPVEEEIVEPITITQDEPADLLKDLSDSDITMINDILSNDENSSDTEIVDLIVSQLKVNAKDAAQIVSFYRDKFMTDPMYALPAPAKPEPVQQNVNNFKYDASKRSKGLKTELSVVQLPSGEYTVVTGDELNDILTAYPGATLVETYVNGKKIDKKLFGGLIGVRGPDNFSLAHNGDTNLAFKKGGKVPKRSAKEIARSLSGKKPQKKLFGGLIGVRAPDNFSLVHNGDANVGF